MRPARPVSSFAVLCLLLAGCADNTSTTASPPRNRPPPFNRTVSWYDDYTMSSQACWRTRTPMPSCPRVF
jgi:hypothetical protein